MDINLIYKRIVEQDQYIDKIYNSDISITRKKELINSAIGVKLYFKQKLELCQNKNQQ